MTPYPAYKPTGLPWLPQIPEHWETIKIRELFVERNQKVSDKDYQPLSVSKGGVVPQIASVAKTDNGDNRKLVKPGDFVINSRSDRKGSSGISEHEGSVSLINLVLRQRTTRDTRFLPYLLKSLPFVEEFYRNGRGIVADLWTTRYSEMKTISLPIPPPDEQTQIARYLDSMTAKINKLIRAKKKQIALLQEQKQAIINQAVTKGLNPNAEMKDSGIDWLGKIPKHWTCCRCKYLFKEINIRSETGEEEHLSMSQKLGLIPDSQLDGHHLMSESYIGGKICEENDLVLNRLKAHLGVFAIAPQRGVVSPDYTTLHINSQKILPRFAEAILTSSSCRSELRIRVRGIVEGFWRLYTDDFYDITLPLPDADEQQQILHFVDEAVAELDKCKNAYTNDICILNEYKESLISSIVTGQVDVRDIPVDDFDPADLVSEAEDDIEEGNATKEREEQIWGR